METERPVVKVLVDEEMVVPMEKEYQGYIKLPEWYRLRFSFYEYLLVAGTASVPESEVTPKPQVIEYDSYISLEVHGPRLPELIIKR